MTSPYLSDDCIYDILKYLQDYQSTLFNCLFVNRFWCKVTVPFLYANPFVISNKNLILTLIPCFSQSEILQLKSQLEFIGVNNINIKDEFKPLFKYPKYLKIYNSFNVNSTIFKWFEGLSYSLCTNVSKREKIREYFCPTFHQTILNHPINIEQLNFDINFIKSDPNFNIPIANLTKLNSLVLNNLDQEIGKEFLSNVAIHCLNLKELKICSLTRNGTIKTSITEKLCTIIQKQNNLEEFKILYYPLNGNLFSSLEFQKHSLVSIEFSKIDFSNTSFKNLINLYNLNYLRFDKCDCIKLLDQFEIFQFASFKLKRLEFILNEWNKNIMSTIIKYLGTSLQFLLLNESITIPMIEKISLYCLNLITLEILVSGFDHFDLSLSPYFKKLIVRKLNIIITDSYGIDMSEMFINLSKSLPVNVKEISFGLNYDNAYDQYYYEIFLENCYHHLEKINLYQLLVGPEFLNSILSYIVKNNNNLITLNLVKTKSIWNDDEIILFNKIKAKGVKIVIVDFINYK
jgi:hypothetical protein